MIVQLEIENTFTKNCQWNIISTIVLEILFKNWTLMECTFDNAFKNMLLQSQQTLFEMFLLGNN